jgi:hypothetical protein
MTIKISGYAMITSSSSDPLKFVSINLLLTRFNWFATYSRVGNVEIKNMEKYLNLKEIKISLPD